MKKLFTTIAITLMGLNSFSQAPNWQWAHNDAGSAYDVANSVALDGSGNSYVTGYFNSTTITFGSTTLNNVGGNDIYVVKYDVTGNVVWAKSEGDFGNDYGISVAVDGSGNIYFTGYFSSASITFGSITLTNGGSYDMYLVKYDASGNVLWAKSSGGSGDENGYNITVDSGGNSYITGFFSSPSITFGNTTLTSTGSSDMYLVKYDASGNVLWATSSGGTSIDQGYCVSLDGSGNSYVIGYFYSPSITFGSTTLTNPDNSGNTADMYIVKFNTGGNAVWAKSAGGIANDVCYSVDVDASGNCYVTGSFISPTITFGSTTLTNAGGRDMYIVKYDASGNTIWAKSAGGNTNDLGYSIVIDGSANSYVTGYFTSDSITFGSTTLTNTDTVNNREIYVVKYDVSGNVVWAKSAGGIYDESSNSIAVSMTGSCYVVGYMVSPSVIFGSTTLTNGGSYDMFIAKLLSDNNINVWPGDANYDHIVDNTDLLPIGLFYGNTGIQRTVLGNVWQADSCADWGVLQANGYDIKNADCNGDSTIDSNDTLAVNLNFNLTHAISTLHNAEQEKTNAPSLYFVTSSTFYNPGDMVDVEVWAGNTATPVSNLYGIAFNINYTASLVQPGTESLTYPASWMGTPGTDAIKISKIDALATTAYGAETRINHTNASGFGKIADFKFQAKSSLTNTSMLHLSVSNYKANDSAGVPVVFNTINDSITIYVSGVGIKEENNNSGITISPNPFTSETTISFNELQKNTTIKIMDAIGKEIKTINFTGKQLVIEKGEMSKGIYFLQITDEKKNIVNKKIIIQ